MKEKKDKKNIIEDPFAVFWYGITAYFELIRDLIFVYMAMSVIAYGIILVYSNSNSLQTDSQSYSSHMTLGSLGFAKHQCFS